MTEGTKALNSSVSTLKKNPGRVGRLVKAAKLLIVPPKQYATGKAREIAEAAVAKLKAKRGLNGVVGEGAGPFSDKALQKKAEDEGKKIALGAAGGALAAHALTSPSRSAEVNYRISRMGRRKGRSDFHKTLSGGRPKRDMLKFDETATRRMGKVVGRKARSVAGKGALAGAVLAGASMLGRHMKKEASMNKDTKDKALAASAVGSGAALGGVLTHDAKKSRIASRVGTKGAYKHMGDSSVAGAEKRLANSAKTLRRMGKPLRRAGIKGAIVGGLAGAALGAAHLKKEAEVVDMEAARKKRNEAKKPQSQKTWESMKRRDAIRGGGRTSPKAARIMKLKSGARKIALGGALAASAASLGAAVHQGLKKKAAAKPAVIPKQEFLGKGKIPAGAKDVSPKAVLKRKGGKVGKIALGVAAGAALAGAAKKHMEKKAADKPKNPKDKGSSIPGMAMAGAGAAHAVRTTKDGKVAVSGLKKQIKHMASKGYSPSAMEARMAVDSLSKPIARRAWKAAGKGAVVGALAGAAMDKMRSKKAKK